MKKCIVYCQNNLCQYYKKLEEYKNYGRCTKDVIYLTWQAGDEYEVTGHNCECIYSRQERI